MKTLSAILKTQKKWGGTIQGRGFLRLEIDDKVLVLHVFAVVSFRRKARLAFVFALEAYIPQHSSGEQKETVATENVSEILHESLDEITRAKRYQLETSSKGRRNGKTGVSRWCLQRRCIMLEVWK
jgi:hypothetical protein